MTKVVIVEDEKHIQESIREIISEHCKNVIISGIANNIETAKTLLNETNPDLVLLDINLPDGTSFELLEQLNQINFKIIFITAFEEYALRAIKLSAIDYLVKPIDPIELINTVNKAVELIDESSNEINLKALLSNIDTLTNSTKKIVLKTAESIFLINIPDIIRCESNGAYTTFYINDDKKIMISKTIKDYEELLDNNGFMRVHKSHIVNLKFIDRYKKADGGSLILKNKSEVPVSFRKKEKLIKLLESLSSI
ncbi:MAG: LytTR family DNA-binding domain-containing protein [Bacteroidales bacterium]|jgi:two-component system LytT family response regulator|nr:LytTR family DNA-binding domain-containing protein [Bacteroidales bacterium]